MPLSEAPVIEPPTPITELSRAHPGQGEPKTGLLTRPKPSAPLLDRLTLLLDGTPDDLRRGIDLAEEALLQPPGQDHRSITRAHDLLVTRYERIALETLERLLLAGPPHPLDLERFVAEHRETEAADHATGWLLDRTTTRDERSRDEGSREDAPISGGDQTTRTDGIIDSSLLRK